MAHSPAIWTTSHLRDTFYLSYTPGGHLWAENKAQWAFKPAVMQANYGDGLVIGFVADPTFRAALDGANIVFLNAVLRGPGHTARVR